MTTEQVRNIILAVILFVLSVGMWALIDIAQQIGFIAEDIHQIEYWYVRDAEQYEDCK